MYPYKSILKSGLKILSAYFEVLLYIPNVFIIFKSLGSYCDLLVITISH